MIGVVVPWWWLPCGGGFEDKKSFRFVAIPTAVVLGSIYLLFASSSFVVPIRC